MCLTIDWDITNELKQAPKKWMRVYKIFEVRYDGLHSPFYFKKWTGPGKHVADRVYLTGDEVHNSIHCYRRRKIALRKISSIFMGGLQAIIVPLLISSKDIVGANINEVACSQVYLSRWQFEKHVITEKRFVFSYT